MSARIRAFIQEWAQSLMQRLDPRERLFLLGGTVVLLVISLSAGTYRLYHKRQEISQAATQGRHDFQRIRRLRDQILSMGVTDKFPDQRQFFTSINSLIDKNRLTPSNVDEKKPGQNARQRYEVTIKFRSVNLVQFLNFVYDLEYGGGIAAAVQKLDIRRALSAKELYDATIVIAMRGG